MTGTLYLCGTPIGNLEDMTYRAVRTLQEVDFIAAEDTRHSLKLLNHFDIKTPFLSYHEHNKRKSGEKIIDFLKNGKSVALITDAGMPCISDPGSDLVRLCYEEGLSVTAVPGPTALITALALSGFLNRQFAFLGFLPANKKDRASALESAKLLPYPIVIYEAPHHLKKTLSDIIAQLGDRKIAITRELTKKFEEIKIFSVSEAVEFYSQNDPKGEYVLVVDGFSADSAEVEPITEADIIESVEKHISSGLSKMDAIKAAAKELSLKKSEVYDLISK
ncbi:MAG: 16S rRNA (cytidine(1402)-2'-O)-methyltransferase [Defluviitaleaceae bacterium]|nr:16S rRNA (cytidine(1402)-2'-O)-methyltransferase [Defluviitaleaceae bacterium]